MKRLAYLLLGLMAVVAVYTCGGDDSGVTPPPPATNSAPIATGTIPAQAMTVGDEATVEVSAFFSDPDGDDLTYAASSSDEAVVTVSVSGSTLSVTAIGKGAATVTATATDPGGLSSTQSVEVTVANRAPVAVGTIPPQSMSLGDSVTVDLSPFFSDPDGDDLTYAAYSSDEAVVTVAVSGSIVSVTAVGKGAATVTATATDPGGLSATHSTEVTVANRAPVAVGTIPPQSMSLGDSVTVDLSPFFSDPDGDNLTYAASSSDGAVVTVSVSGTILSVATVNKGEATLSVSATDPGGLSATQSVAVTVVGKPGTLQLVLEHSESDIGAVLVHIVGPDLTDSVKVSLGLLAYTVSTEAGLYAFVTTESPATTPVPSGMAFRFSSPDVTEPDRYTATVIQVATTTYKQTGVDVVKARVVR